jgi:hypothetical protein
VTVCCTVAAGSEGKAALAAISLVVLAHPPSAKATLAAMTKEEYFFIILSRCYVKSVNIIRRVTLIALTFIVSGSEPNVNQSR